MTLEYIIHKNSTNRQRLNGAQSNCYTPNIQWPLSFGNQETSQSHHIPNLSHNHKLKMWICLTIVNLYPIPNDVALESCNHNDTGPINHNEQSVNFQYNPFENYLFYTTFNRRATEYTAHREGEGAHHTKSGHLWCLPQHRIRSIGTHSRIYHKPPQHTELHLGYLDAPNENSTLTRRVWFLIESRLEIATAKITTKPCIIQCKEDILCWWRYKIYVSFITKSYANLRTRLISSWPKPNKCRFCCVVWNIRLESSAADFKFSS